MAVVLLIVGLGIGMVLGPAVSPPSAPPAQTITLTVTETVGAPGAQTITVTETAVETRVITETETVMVEEAAKEYLIGLAIAVSGGYSVDGPRRRNAAILAIDEMNMLLENSGSPVRFNWIHEDTKSTAEGAIAAVPKLAAAGVQIIVGPLATSETKAIMDFVNSRKIVAISPSSTGTAARVKDDFVFRMAPPDVYQAPAIARIAWEVGIRNLVILARNDDYGKGLADGVEETFKNLGGNVVNLLYDYTQPDLSADVERASTAVANFGEPDKTGVLVIGFDETVKIYDRARLDPVLSEVRWFGNDAVKRPTFLPPDAKEEIAEFQLTVKLIGTAPARGPEDNPVVKRFIENYVDRFGEKPSLYSYYSYDAAMVAMLTVLSAGVYSGEVFKQILPSVAMKYFGVTGWKLLDEYGDSASPVYDIWTVVKKPDGTWDFETVGFYDGATGAITFYEMV